MPSTKSETVTTSSKTDTMSSVASKSKSDSVSSSTVTTNNSNSDPGAFNFVFNMVYKNLKQRYWGKPNSDNDGDSLNDEYDTNGKTSKKVKTKYPTKIEISAKNIKSEVLDKNFSTKQKLEPELKPGERYITEDEIQNDPVGVLKTLNMETLLNKALESFVRVSSLMLTIYVFYITYRDVVDQNDESGKSLGTMSNTSSSNGTDSNTATGAKSSNSSAYYDEL